MAVVPLQSNQRILRPNPAITLAEYARFIQYDECAFWGVNNPDDTYYECRDIWSLDQRNYIYSYLSEAQKEIEDQIGYFLSSDWVVGTINDERDSLDRYVDQQLWRNVSTNRSLVRTYNTRWQKVIQVGVRAVEDIALNQIVDHTSDPAVIGPVATTVTDINEIVVYHPGEDLEINPSKITLAGGFLTIEIPRCRMVNFAQLDNPESGWDYADLANFESTVDIKRVYTDTSGTQGNLVCGGGCGECTTTDVAGCLQIVNERLGTVEMKITNCGCGCYPVNVGLNYYCGQLNTTKNEKDIIVRLAHAKMPYEPCGCNFAQRLWNMDRKTPEIITRERANNPFGLNDGSWTAWLWTQQIKGIRFGTI